MGWDAHLHILLTACLGQLKPRFGLTANNTVTDLRYFKKALCNQTFWKCKKKKKIDWFLKEIVYIFILFEN